MNDTQLALQPSAIQTYEQMEAASVKLAASKLMGEKTTPEMVFGLMLLCQCEGLNPIAAMKRYHIVEGRPSMRADAMQAEFIAKGGGILFHVRTDQMVAATLFIDKSKMDAESRKRATDRFEILWRLDLEVDDAKRSELMISAAQLSVEGEETIIRTLADCIDKGLACKSGGQELKANWRSSPRQMLTARVITEGVRLVNPGLIAGIYSEDETRDIIQQDRAEAQRITTEPKPGDEPAIKAMIDQRDEELKTATGARRQTVLGLKSELVNTLAGMGVVYDTPAPSEPAPTVGGRPVQAVETVVLPPAANETAPKTRTKRAPATPTEATATDVQPTERAQDWQAVVCHLGTEGGRMKGRTLRQIFDTVKHAMNIGTMVKWFRDNVADKPEDKSLLIAAETAGEARRAELQADRSQAATTTPAPNKTQEQVGTATPTDWREYVITGKHPQYSGKKLGTLTADEVRNLKGGYLDAMAEDRLTIDQKRLKAMVSMALATFAKTEEAEDDIPRDPAPEAEAGHLTALRDAIESSGLNRNSFFEVCHRHDWLPADVTTIEAITAEQCDDLAAEWPSVAKAVKEAQP